MIILGIETSCDETAAAILKDQKESFQILSSIVSSQIKIHAKFGGVVPNLAAREHTKNIVPVLEQAFKKAQIKPFEIDLIAVTKGPGLIPALLVGTSAAKALAYAFQKHLVGIHHIEGHIYANFIEKNLQEIKFPLLCLVVSGGHTQLIFMKNHFNYEIIGETQDDAAGEAFDKVARMLSLPYPGGPAISQEAKKFQELKPKISFLKPDLPRPMLNSKDFNFSFSGLKTAVLYETKKNKKLLKDKKYIQAVSFEFQQAVVDVLVKKTLKAAQERKVKTVMLAGGVSANRELRVQLEKTLKKELPTVEYYLPDMKDCVDNASMIATAAYFRKKMGKIDPKISWKNLEANANLKLC